MSDRALICVTDSFVPPNEVIAVDTKQNKLYLGSGTVIPARISVRRLHDDERIIMNQMQSAANQADTNRNRDAETVKLMAKIDTQGVNLDKLTGSIQTLTQMHAEEAAQRDKWRENPLCSPEAIADYLLTTNSLHIKPDVAVALIEIAYGKTHKKAAIQAKISIATIKRAVRKMRTTAYSRLFTRKRKQKQEAWRSIEQPDKTMSTLREMAERNPDELRSFTEQIIHRAQSNDVDEPSNGNHEEDEEDS
jgi:hypothetical protein